MIAEARESGNVGIFRHDGEVRMGLIDEIVHAIAPEQILFEAPRKDQQVWFVRRFGPNVNLGNIPPEDVALARDDPTRSALGHRRRRRGRGPGDE